MRGDRIRVAQLHQEIANLKQGNRKISEYFTELRSLWEELEQYRPLPRCNCPIPCTCVAMRNSRSFKLEDRIIQFLIGLNDEYQGVASQVLLMEPMPLINKVFTMVMQQERKLSYGLNSSASDDSNALVNAVEGSKSYGRGRGRGNGNNFQGRGINSNGFQGRGKGNGKECTYCGKGGNIVEDCYRKNGFPLNWGRGGGYANHIDAEEHEEKLVNNAGSSSTAGMNEADGRVSLTKEQYSGLIALLEKSNMEEKCSANVAKASGFVNAGGNNFLASNELKKVNSKWILDTGATHHICYSLEWFITYNQIDVMEVTLPNGSSVQSKIHGRVQLNDELIVDNVLYVPEFAVNLLSISKLCSEMFVSLIFHHDHCLIQGKTNMRRIGLAKQEAGLYYLEAKRRESGSANSLAIYNKDSVSTAVLWHLRLGHLSFDRMKCLNKQYSYIPSASHSACDICHLSRQKKLPFPISNNNANELFELIHVDIWGPFSTVSVHGFRYFLTILDDHSRHVWTVMLKLKSEVGDKIKGFVNMVETQFGRKIKRIRSDDGLKFFLNEFFCAKGILHERSCVYTPQ
jgi:hypothetical protein